MKKNGRVLPKKSQLPPGAPACMLTSDAEELFNAEGKSRLFIMTKCPASMAQYNRFDGIICLPAPTPTSNNYDVSSLSYNVSFSRTNGTSFALIDGGANGGLSSRNMRQLSYNPDGKRVNIGIAGDHQVTGKPLGTFCTITKIQLGLVKFVWNHYAEVREQESSIRSTIQLQHYGNLVGSDCKQVGGKQMIMTPNDYMIPIIIKSDLPYIDQFYPSDHQMATITREEIMTSENNWDQGIYDTDKTADEMIT